MTELNTRFGELRSQLQRANDTREARAELIEFLRAARFKDPDQFDEVWRPYLLAQRWIEPFWEASSHLELETLSQVVCGARFELDLGHRTYHAENVHELQQLANSPHLQWVSNISFYRSALSARDLQILLDSPHLRDLKVLDLAHCRNLRSLQPIVTSTNLAALEALHLDKVTTLPREALSTLASTTALPNLTTLSLTEMYIARAVIEDIKANPNLSKLTHLEVSPKKIYG